MSSYGGGAYGGAAASVGMTFKQLQDAVLAQAFDESIRPDVKRWINSRLALLWDFADWSFAENVANVTVTAGSQNVTGLPADFLVARALQRDDGTPLAPIYTLQDFERLYVGTSATQTGLPEAYTVLSTTTILVGPTSSQTSTAYLLTYQQGPTLLVNDADVPAFPAAYHMALVYGAKADGYVSHSILLADPFEQRWNEYLQAMTKKYLSSMDQPGRQSPAYRSSPVYSGW